MKTKMFAYSFSAFPMFVVGVLVFINPINITLRPLGLAVLLLSVIWVASACLWVYYRESKRKRDCDC